MLVLVLYIYRCRCLMIIIMQEQTAWPWRRRWRSHCCWVEPWRCHRPNWDHHVQRRISARVAKIRSQDWRGFRNFGWCNIGHGFGIVNIVIIFNVLFSEPLILDTDLILWWYRVIKIYTVEGRSFFIPTISYCTFQIGEILIYEGVGHRRRRVLVYRRVNAASN